MTDAPLYWEVEMKVFAFDTEAEARAFNDALIDAFCAMPEADGFASSHRVIGCHDADPGKGHLETPITHWREVLPE